MFNKLRSIYYRFKYDARFEDFIRIDWRLIRVNLGYCFTGNHYKYCRECDKIFKLMECQVDKAHKHDVCQPCTEKSYLFTLERLKNG